MKLLGIEVNRNYHTKVKLQAVKQGKSLKQYILDLIDEDLKKHEQKEKE